MRGAWALLCLFLWSVPSARAEDREAVRRWSTDMTSGDYRRNVARREIAPFYPEDPRRNAYFERVLVQTMSADPADQRGAYVAESRLLTDPRVAETPEFVAARDIATAFTAVDRRWATSPPDTTRFLALAKEWESFRIPQAAMGRLCAAGLCAPGASREDIGAVRETFTIMSPFGLHGGGRPWMSSLGVWQRVMADPVSMRAAVRLGAKVANRVRVAEATGKVEGNLFGDLKAAFHELGVTGEEAEAKAIDLLGLYGTRGVDMHRVFGARFPVSKTLAWLNDLLLTAPQIGGAFAGVVGGMADTAGAADGPKTLFDAAGAGEYTGAEVVGAGPGLAGYFGRMLSGLRHRGHPRAFADAHTYPVIAALTLAAAGTTYLDSIAIREGRSYALPPEITSHMSYTRPYHFWLSASLVKELKARGFGTGAAVEAVHRVGLAYELKGNVHTVEAHLLGRHPAYTAETQKDILFNAAGAVWGARQREGRLGDLHLDVDVVADRWRTFTATTSRIDKLDEVFRIAPPYLRGPVGLLINDEAVRYRVNVLAPFEPLEVWRSEYNACGYASVVGSSRVDLQACKLEYSIVSPK